MRHRTMHLVLDEVPTEMMPESTQNSSEYVDHNLPVSPSEEGERQEAGGSEYHCVASAVNSAQVLLNYESESIHRM